LGQARPLLEVTGPVTVRVWSETPSFDTVWSACESSHKREADL
jgi:hypothetical protein